MDVKDLTLEHFRDLIGDNFQVGEQSLQLKDAERLRTGQATESNSSFSLLLTGPPVFDQGMIDLSHSQIGDFSLFIVPVAEDEHGRTYESIFNRVT